MRTINYLFSSQQRFKYFLEKNNIQKDKEHFIQVFTGSNNPKELQSILQIISENLPHSSIIASSTAGEIIEGGMIENSTVISLTTFKDTKVNVQLIDKASADTMAQKISSTMISPKTKLILAFNNVFKMMVKIY